MIEIIQENVAHPGKKGRHDLCRCHCGKEFIAGTWDLKRGKYSSCGCTHPSRRMGEIALRHGHTRGATHGQKRSSLYSRWAAMIQRCSNPNDPAFSRYGGRGITVCERWRTFENFLADMGEPPPRMTIERVNNSLGYSPENCVWDSYAKQAANRRCERDWHGRFKSCE